MSYFQYKLDRLNLVVQDILSTLTYEFNQKVLHNLLNFYISFSVHWADGNNNSITYNR